MSIGFFGLLTIIFVIMKLTNFIDWSWLVVFSPLIVGFIVQFIFIMLIGLLSRK